MSVDHFFLLVYEPLEFQDRQCDYFLNFRVDRSMPDFDLSEVDFVFFVPIVIMTPSCPNLHFLCFVF